MICSGASTHFMRRRSVFHENDPVCLLGTHVDQSSCSFYRGPTRVLRGVDRYTAVDIMRNTELVLSAHPRSGGIEHSSFSLTLPPEMRVLQPLVLPLLYRERRDGAHVTFRQKKL